MIRGSVTDVTSAPESHRLPPRTSTDRSLYFNRELSWMEFNDRVLQLAEDPSVPLLERLKFLAIVSSNLDEFFMVRVAGLHDQIDAGIEKPLQDGRTPTETIDAIRDVVREHAERQSRCLDRELRPALAEHGIRIVGYDDVDARRAARARRALPAPDLPGPDAAGGRASGGRSRTSPTCRCRSA